MPACEQRVGEAGPLSRVLDASPAGNVKRSTLRPAPPAPSTTASPYSAATRSSEMTAYRCAGAYSLSSSGRSAQESAAHQDRIGAGARSPRAPPPRTIAPAAHGRRRTRTSTRRGESRRAGARPGRRPRRTGSRRGANGEPARCGPRARRRSASRAAASSQTEAQTRPCPPPGRSHEDVFVASPPRRDARRRRSPRGHRAGPPSPGAPGRPRGASRAGARP